MAKEDGDKTMSLTYAFREGRILAFKNAATADPQVIGQSLADIAATTAGRLLPRKVVEAARSRGHVLHRYFEWDDEKAAENHRLDTARRMIQAVVIIEEDEEGDEQPTRGWISVEDKNGVAYRTGPAVRVDVDLQLAVMQRARIDLRAWIDRYKELAEICKMVKVALKELEDRLADRERKGKAPEDEDGPRPSA